MVGLRRQQVQEGNPDTPSETLQLLLGEDVPRLERKHNPSNEFWVSWSPPRGTGLENLQMEWSRKHNRMYEPPQQNPFDVEQSQLYSELHLDDEASHFISGDTIQIFVFCLFFIFYSQFPVPVCTSLCKVVQTSTVSTAKWNNNISICEG